MFAYSGEITATGPFEVMEALYTFLTTNGWAVIEDERNHTAKPLHAHFVVSNTGESGTENYIIGVGASLHTNGLNAFVFPRAFKAYTDDDDFIVTPNAPRRAGVDDVWISGIPVWSGDIKCWFHCSASHLVIVLRIQNNYYSSYVGGLETYCLPSEYPNSSAVINPSYARYEYITDSLQVIHGADPYYTWYNRSTSDHYCVPYDSLSNLGSIPYPIFYTKTFNYWDYRSSNAVLTPSGQWWDCLGVSPTSYYWSSAKHDTPITYPAGAETVGFPLFLCNNTISDRVISEETITFGSFKDCIFVPGMAVSVEDVISISGVGDYKIFPDTSSSGWDRFFGIRIS